MEGPVRTASPDQMRAAVGTEMGVSNWVTIDQKMVDTFKANKVEVVTMNEAEFDAWRAVAQKTSYKNFAEKVPGGKELIDKALSVK